MSTQPLVLVADDEPRITKLVSIALGEAGFRVVTANSGEEALEKAEEVRPDIVLLDIVMPDLDGIEVMRQLRERRPVAVILLTAKGEVVDQSPSSQAPRGSTITLSVSKGPPMSTVPDVTAQDEGSAQSTLEQAGFVAQVQRQDVNDPGLDGIVLSQSPTGGSKATQGSTVTITVGRLVSQGGPGSPPPPPPAEP